MWAGPVWAQPPQAPQTTPSAGQTGFPAGARMAHVNLQVVLSKSKLGQAGSAQLKTLTDQRDAELKAREQEIADLQAKLGGPERQSLTPDALSNAVRDLNRRRAQLNFDLETWQMRVEQFSQELLAGFRAQLLPVIETIREERGLLLVLSLPLPGVLAADPRLDLSAEVIQRLDERSK